MMLNGLGSVASMKGSVLWITHVFNDFKELGGAFERLNFSVVRHHKDHFRYYPITQ